MSGPISGSGPESQPVGTDGKIDPTGALVARDRMDESASRPPAQRRDAQRRDLTADTRR
jgi:hypothetical protein